ncbi:hypothetical protein D3C73_1025090 [compost metagenome]
MHQVFQCFRGRRWRRLLKHFSQFIERSFISARSALGLCKDIQGVAQALDHRRAEHRGVCQLRQAGAQGQQQTGQITAVYGGDVMGVQRFQGLRVVPVVEVLPIALQTVHAVQ